MKTYTLATVCAAMLCGSCRQSPQPNEPVTYKTLTVATMPCTLQRSYTASLQGWQVVEVRPQVSGLITRICIEEGQEVRKGQLLFVIDQVPYQAALAQAEANVAAARAKLATAQLDYDSKLALRQQGVVHDYDVRAARNALSAAQAELDLALATQTNARNNLTYTEIRSAVDGVAGMINYRTGALVSSSITQPLVTLTDDSRMYAYFSITEGQFSQLLARYGSRAECLARFPQVELTLASGTSYPHRGTLGAISGMVTQGTGAVTLRADFANPQHLLCSGASATVVVPTQIDSCIVIPQGATYELQDKVFVYKVIAGKTVSAPVSVYSLNGGTDYVVEQGLRAGDVIIAEGAGLVSEGTQVTAAGERSKP